MGITLHDAGDKVEITVPTAAALDDLTVKVTTTALSVRQNTGEALLDVPQLFSTVDAGKSAWNVDGGALHVELHKLDPSETWTQLDYRPSAVPEARPRSETDSALEALENVRKLFKAAVDGSIERIKQLAPTVSAEGLGQVKDAKGNTALHYAALGGHTEAVRYLLEKEGIDVNATNEQGEPPLSAAAGAGKLEVVKLLLENGAKPDLAAESRPQPLHNAASDGDVAVVEALLAAGANVDTPSDSGTPLLWACGSGRAKAVGALLAAGADANARNDDGVGAMLMAAAAGDREVVEALASHGADPNLAATGGVTAMHAAAEMGHLGVVEALVQAGANPDAEDVEHGAKPIHGAASAGHSAVVEYLLPLTKARQGETWTTAALLAGGSSARSSEAQQSEPLHTEEPDPEKAAMLKRKGDEAFVAREYKRAADFYDDSLRHDISNHLVWANLSAARLRLGEADKALISARTARALQPKYMKAWYREAEAAKALRQFEDAAQAYFEAYSLDPDNRELAQKFQEAVAAGKADYAQRKASGQ